MMKTILIIVAFAGNPDGGVHTRTVEFETLQACQIAAVQVKQMRGSAPFTRVSAVCAPTK